MAVGRERIAVLVLIAAAVAMPFAVKGFLTFQLTVIVANAIAVMGLAVLTGFSGQISLGQGAFVALGGYSTAILVGDAGLPWLAAVPVAAIGCFAVGFVLGLPAARLEAEYLALATFALAVAMPPLLKLTPLVPWTGGAQGMSVNRPGVPPGLPLSLDQWLYLLVFAMALAMLGLARGLARSTLGRALVAIRENDVAAGAMGIDVARYKAVAFALGALYAGVAGALAAMTVGFVAPDGYTLTLSIGLLTAAVVGGVGWLPGAFVGSAFISLVPNLADHVSKGIAGAVYGGILLLFVHLAPEGVGGVYRRLVNPGAHRDH